MKEAFPENLTKEALFEKLSRSNYVQLAQGALTGGSFFIQKDKIVHKRNTKESVYLN